MYVLTGWKIMLTHEWTGEEEALLIKMRAEGRTMSAIARELGISKNSVCGKAHRLRQRGEALPEADHRSRPARVGKPPKTEETVVVKIVRPTKSGKPRGGVRATVADVVKPKFSTTHVRADAPVEGVSIVDAEAWHCKAIIRDYTETERVVYCGKAVIPGHSWCEAHAKLFYMSPEERRRRRAA